MRRLLLVLLAVLLAAPVMLVTAPAARACSCAGGEPEEFIAHADLVAEVSVESSGTASRTGGDRWMNKVYELTVHRSWVGTSEPQVTVRTAEGSSMCGLVLRPGQRYLLLAERHDGHWRTSLCSGSTPVGGSGDGPMTVTVADVEAQLGSGEAPPSPDAGAPTTADDAGEGNRDRGATVGWWAAGGALGVIALLVIVLGSRRAR